MKSALAEASPAAQLASLSGEGGNGGVKGGGGLLRRPEACGKD